MKPTPALAVEMRGVRVTLGQAGGRMVQAAVEELVVASGERLALTGPSGCGKSTLLNLVSGLLRPDAGAVKVLDTELGGLSVPGLDDFRGRHLGIVWQSFNLLESFSAMENVLIGMRFGRWGKGGERRARATALLERVGLSHRLSARPGSLSIGERQRVAIARALASEPRIILADEPTGSLDPATAEEIFALLTEVCVERGCTLLLVTHDHDLAKRLDRQFDCRGIVHSG
jgi:ABC-type lipoprotein export system ATPase subunit